MAYRMAQLLMTLSETEGHFCRTTGEIWRFNYSVFTYKLESTPGL